MKSFAFSLSLAIFSQANAAVVRRSNPVVDLGYVKYEGVYNATSGYDAVFNTKQCMQANLSLRRINSFFGIKFAAPPTGKLRWQPPVNIESSNNYSLYDAPLNASATGPSCVQGNPAWQGTPPGGAGQSEDCLLLDVKVPANPTSKFLPVAIQIHGGGKQINIAAWSILHNFFQATLLAMLLRFLPVTLWSTNLRAT